MSDSEPTPVPPFQWAFGRVWEHFWLSQWLGGVLLPVAECEEGGKMSSTNFVPFKMPNRAQMRNIFSLLRGYWAVYMQFLFRRFKNINKICQASESRLRELTETEGVKSVFGHFERVITLLKAEMGPCSALTLSVIWRWRNLFSMLSTTSFFILLQTFTDPALLLPCSLG